MFMAPRAFFAFFWAVRRFMDRRLASKARWSEEGAPRTPASCGSQQKRRAQGPSSSPHEQQRQHACDYREKVNAC